MSFRMRTIWALKEATDSELRILQVMVWNYKEDPNLPPQDILIGSHISNETLAIQTGIGLRQVIKNTQSLISKGLLINQKSNSKGKNSWHINIAKIEELHKETINENTVLIHKQRSPQHKKFTRMAKERPTVNCSAHTEKSLSTVNSGTKRVNCSSEMSELEGTLSLDHYNHIYIYLFDKSNKKADKELLMKFIKEHHRAEKQIEAMIDRVNTYDLVVVMYNDALNKLSYLTYFEKLAPEFIETKLSSYIDSLKSKPLKIVRSVDPAHDKGVDYWLNRYQEVDDTPVNYIPPVKLSEGARMLNINKLKELMKDIKMNS